MTVPPSVRLTIVAALFGLCATALLPAVAHAGAYKMYSCEPPGVNIASPTAGPWRPYSEGNPSTQAVSTCGAAPGGAMTISFNGHPGNYPLESFAKVGWELPATALNAQIAIVRVKSWVVADTRSLAYPPGDLRFQVGYPDNLGPMAGNSVGDTRAGGYASPTNDPAAPLHRLGLTCANGGAGEPCRLLYRPNLVIYGTEADLVESAPPVGAIAGGTLSSAGAKAGAAVLSYTAADGQSGVERVEVLLDDTVAGVQDFSRNLALPLAAQGAGDCTYTGLAACPPSRGGDIAVDTTKVADGVRSVTLRVTDAAGNRANVAGPQINVVNSGVQGAPNGTPASRLAKLTARFAATTQRSRRLAYTARPLIRGRLVNEQGKAIARATVAVLARPRRAGARDRQVATVRTAANGAFTYRLARGPSRRLTFAYDAYVGDRRPASRSILNTHVRALVSASATPRSTRAGRQITLGGRLRLLPREGVRIEIQARDGRNWRTIGSVRTKRRGAFSWRYRFSTAARGRTYAFRARVVSEIYPFAAGNSRPVRVSVR
ncbi:MAG: hypothetical protein Q8O56_00480 [Solirubrobacteraceae bacterium]|nr:hypothetical protein [Solirubrobacteraceae bacterium]